MIAALGEWLMAIGCQCGMGGGKIGAEVGWSLSGVVWGGGIWLKTIGCQCWVAASSHLIDWSTPKGSLYRQYLCSHLCFPQVQLLSVINMCIWGKITNYCSSAPIVFKLGQNIKLSKCFKFLEKRIKIFHFLMTSSLFFEKKHLGLMHPC